MLAFCIPFNHTVSGNNKRFKNQRNLSLSVSLSLCPPLSLSLSGYVVVVGFISFAVCYRHGPLVEERSVNILTWTLQLFGLLLVYAGVQIQQVALAVIVAAVCAKNVEYPLVLALGLWRWVLRS